MALRKLFSLYKMPFYAVAKGREGCGIFNTWAECESKVKGFTGAVYKKFNTLTDAETFIIQKGGKLSTKPSEPIIKATIKKVDEEEEIAKLEKELLEFYEEFDTEFSENQSTSSKSSNSSKYIKRHLPQDKSAPNKKFKMAENLVRKDYGNASYLEDNNGFVQVYTDGSCINNGKSNASAGFGVYFDDNHPMNTAKGVSGRATNNCGEIQAASEAIKIAKESNIKKLCINTDSDFLIKSATNWMPGWKSRDWQLSSGGEVKNKTDFQELDRAMSKDIKVKWNYIPAHIGVHGNEQADALAKQGSEMYKQNRYKK